MVRRAALRIGRALNAERHATARMSKAVLIGAVPPIMIKTPASLYTTRRVRFAICLPVIRLSSPPSHDSAGFWPLRWTGKEGWRRFRATKPSNHRASMFPHGL